MVGLLRCLALLSLISMGGCQEYQVHETVPKLKLDTRRIDFSEVTVGHRSEVGILLENTGRGDLEILGWLLDGTTSADFSLPDLGADRVEPGADLVLSVRYTPDMLGQDYGRAVLNTDCPEEPRVEVDLSGFGVEPGLRLNPGTLWFGDVAVGDSATLTTEVKATGTGTTRITDIFFDEDDPAFLFSLPGEVELPWSLSSGFSFEVEVVFQPTDAEPRDLDLLFSSNDPASPVRAVRLLGNTAEAPDEDQPPVVEITSPIWGQYLEYGANETLTGLVVDVEDGPQNLVAMWYANGALLGTSTPAGDGRVSMLTDQLPLGTALITLTAVDSAGQVGTDSVSVTTWDMAEPVLYTISGGDTLYHYWVVDDDIIIQVDGQEIFRDQNRSQDNHPPVEFEASRGSSLRIIASDQNYCTRYLSALTLHFGTGASQQLTEEFCSSACPDHECYDGYAGPWPGVFLDQTWTIEIP